MKTEFANSRSMPFPLSGGSQPGKFTGTPAAAQQKIPLPEIIAESDRLFNLNNAAAVGEHLRKWRSQAQQIGDKSGELSLLSELMGHYRMAGNRTAALAAVRDGLALISELDISGTVSCGTILINAATALQAFGEFTQAMRYYTEAFRCYQTNLEPDDWRFAGLLNNMAGACSANGDYALAEDYYQKALKVLAAGNNLMDSAVTWVNLAQLYDMQDPTDQRINEALDRAEACFDHPAAERNGYYAHTCSKCASAFGLFGRENFEAELKSRAEDFYARS